MKCETNNEDLRGFMDDDLDPIERKRVTDHLAQCQECRETVRELRAMSAVLAKWVVPEPTGLATASALLARAAGPTAVGATSRADARETSSATFSSSAGVPRRFASNRNQLFAAAAAVIICVLAVASIQVFQSRELSSEQTSVAQKAPVSDVAPSGTAPATGLGGSTPSESAPADASSVSNQAAPTEKQQRSESATTQDDEEVGAAASGADADAPASAPAPAVAAPPTISAPANEPGAEGKRDAQESVEVTAADGISSEKPKVLIPSEDQLAKTKKERDMVRQQPSKPGRAAGGRASSSTIAKSGVVALESEDPRLVADRVSSAAQASGGYVQGRSGTKNKSGDRGESITVRIPTDRFDAFIASVRALGTVVDESTSAENLGPKLAEIDAKDSRSERESRDDSAAARPNSSRQREEILDRVRLATVRVTVSPRPRTRSAAVVTNEQNAPPVAGMLATPSPSVESARAALDRGVGRALDICFAGLLLVLEFGPTALLASALVLAATRALRRGTRPSQASSAFPGTLGRAQLAGSDVVRAK